jgi:hypothetical protein
VEVGQAVAEGPGRAQQGEFHGGVLEAGRVGCQNSYASLTRSFSSNATDYGASVLPFVGGSEFAVMWSFLYFGLGRLAQLIVLRFRSRESKEIEILVLRHQLAILGRQRPRPRLEPKDRAGWRCSVGCCPGPDGQRSSCNPTP